MSWKEFIANNSIAASYQDCNTVNLNIYNNSCTNFYASAIQFLSKPKSLILQGLPGRGKTYFMLTLVKELLTTARRPLHEIRFINASDLDDRVSEEIKRYNSASYYLNSLIEVPLRDQEKEPRGIITRFLISAWRIDVQRCYQRI